jgi:hypothetical protein
MRTFGHVILGVLATLMVLGGLVLIIFGAVLLSWGNDPGFGGVFTTGGLISLLLGLGLVLAGAFLFRRLDAGAPTAGGSGGTAAGGPPSEATQPYDDFASRDRPAERDSTTPLRP